MGIASLSGIMGFEPITPDSWSGGFPNLSLSTYPPQGIALHFIDQ